ncbi:NAD(P)-binding protein, partial [Cubamyces sp. BRFM 1775]
DAYATSDIVVRHPTDETLWKIFGHIDEQIILSNGENTNPIPLEAIINDDPHVKASLIFGHGRFQNGVLIEPAREHVIDPNSIEDLERFRNMIWPSVQRANDYAPQHSKIFKEMILIASPSKPFQHNVKGLLRRKFIISDYESEIDALYHAVENSATSDVEPPTSWDDRSTLVFVREIVQNTLGRFIPDDADIFRSGGDSLQATRIRNIIRRSLRSTGHHEEASGLPPDVVFDSPTILALSKAVLAIASGDQPEAPNIPRTPDDLWTYVEKYAADLPARPEGLSDHSRPGKDIVLITGTTGGFGCDVLEHLLRDDQVERVYALNRKDSDAMTRQREQFCARGLDEKLLDSPKYQLVEGTLHEDGFGIRADLLDEIRRLVTHVMHNGERRPPMVNMSLASFEADLQGTRNLVKLALESPYKTPPSVIFVSSVGVFSNFEGAPPALEAPLDDPVSAFGTGYSEAKWIAERVLQRVTQTTALHTVTVRLGQVCGDRVGHWNEREWFPALVKSARFQGCLPDAKGSVLWVPSYDAAKAFAEMRHSHGPVLHLVHPRPIPWSDIIAPIASQLNVPLVPFAEWLAKLQKSAEADTGLSVELMEKNPALRLLAFFTNVVLSPEREPMGGVYLSTQRSTAASSTLARLTALNEGCVKRWLDEWKKSGFL